jgi:hypothetical protein
MGTLREPATHVILNSGKIAVHETHILKITRAKWTRGDSNGRVPAL